MIIIKIDTDNTIIEQFKKVTEEYKEVIEAIEDSKKTEFQNTELNHKIIEECFDLRESANQIILKLTDELGYKKHYKKHLLKLIKGGTHGNIKIKEYLEV